MIRRNLELDRLRAFAVIMTVFIHYVRVFFPWSISPEYQHGTSVINIWSNSWTGVDLFFVISGYIISKSIIGKIDYLRGSNERLAHYIKEFFVKRFYRIFPVASIGFIFVLLCSIFFNQSGSFSTVENNIEAGISILTYTFNYYFAFGTYKGLSLSPYWSLSVEEQFYLLLPIFLVLTKSTKHRVFILLGLLAAITFVIRPFSPIDSIFLTQTRCDGLIYGSLLYYLMQKTWVQNIISNNSGSKYIRMIITFIMVMVLSSVTALGFSNNIVIPLGCIISSLLVAIAALEKNIIIAPYFLQSCLDYLGSRSFSLYIVHFPMFTLTQEIMFRFGRMYDFELDANLSIYYTLIAFLLITIFTEISYRFIERPFIEKCKSFSSIDKNENHQKLFFPKAI